MSADNARVRRLGLIALPLTAAIAACGAADPAAKSATTTAQPAAARAAIRVTAPGPGKAVPARTYGRTQLRAVVRVAGYATSGQQLALSGRCGGYSCDGITFADADGKWRTRLEVVTPKGKSTVRLSVGYADGSTSATSVYLTLRRGVIPEASPQHTPPKDTGSTTGGQSAPAGGHPFSGPRTMIVIGDSLAVGMARGLQDLLEGWDVPIDARTGRPINEGMQILAETGLPPGAAGNRAILGFSLGTNDGPGNVDILESAVRESISRLGSHGCAIWATIARPPLNGVSYKAMNNRLLALGNDPDLAGRLIIVPWKESYDRHKSWRMSDGVHATPEGYAARAQLYEQAARSCAA
jgi:hypothetical protein